MMKQSCNNGMTPMKRSSLFGELTAAKTSGIVYSIGAILPVALSLLFIVLISAAGNALEGVEGKDWYLYVSYALTPFAFCLIALWYKKHSGICLKTAIVEQKCHWKYILLAVLLQTGLLFSLSELNGLFLQFLEKFGYEDPGIQLPSMDGVGFVGVLVVVAFLPALFEEVFFRGMLLKGLRCFGEVGAVLLCGALFSLYHQNPAQTIYQFCCGAAFALLAIRSGSLLPTFIAHFANNAVILIFQKLGIEFSRGAFIAMMIISSLCLIGAMAYLLFFDKRKQEEKSEKAEKDGAERKTFFLFASVGIVICAITWFAVLIQGV